MAQSAQPDRYRRYRDRRRGAPPRAPKPHGSYAAVVRHRRDPVRHGALDACTERHPVTGRTCGETWTLWQRLVGRRQRARSALGGRARAERLAAAAPVAGLDLAEMSLSDADPEPAARAVLDALGDRVTVAEAQALAKLLLATAGLAALRE